MEKERLAEYLEQYHMGALNAATSRELELTFGIKGIQVRHMVNALRRDGVPIASNGSGYFYPHKSGCEKLLLQMPCKISCLFLRVHIGFVVVHTGCSKAHKSRCLCHACGAKRQCDGRHSNVYILDCIR